MSLNPLSNYQSLQKEALEGRDLEASIIDLATQRLQAAQLRLKEGNDKEILDAALRFNQKVWTFFQTEMMDEENPMPPEIKNNMLSLIAYIDKRSFMTMAEPTPEKLDILININRNIVAGLRQHS